MSTPTSCEVAPVEVLYQRQAQEAEEAAAEAVSEEVAEEAEEADEALPVVSASMVDEEAEEANEAKEAVEAVDEEDGAVGKVEVSCDDSTTVSEQRAPLADEGQKMHARQAATCPLLQGTDDADAGCEGGQGEDDDSTLVVQVQQSEKDPKMVGGNPWHLVRQALSPPHLPTSHVLCYWTSSLLPALSFLGPTASGERAASPTQDCFA